MIAALFPHLSDAVIFTVHLDDQGRYCCGDTELPPRAAVMLCTTQEELQAVQAAGYLAKMISEQELLQRYDDAIAWAVRAFVKIINPPKMTDPPWDEIPDGSER